MRNTIAFVATIVFITYLILDAFLDADMWDANITFTDSLQSNSFTGEEAMFNFFTYLAFLPPLIAFVAFIIMDRKLNVLIFMCVATSSVVLNELLKNIYHQPRPYMVPSTGIHPYKCNPDYGKPSGHSQNSVVMAFAMPLLLFPSLFRLRKFSAEPVASGVNEDQRDHTGYTIDSLSEFQALVTPTSYEPKQSYVPVEQSRGMIIGKILIIFALASCCFMTGLSRVYLGVHSFGQVLLGWVVAVYFLIIYATVLKCPIRSSRFCLQMIESFNNIPDKYRQIIPISLIGLAFNVAFSILLLELNIHVFTTSSETQTWVQQINLCNVNHDINITYTTKSINVLYNGVFYATQLASVITGALIGGYLAKGSYHEGHFNKSLQQAGLMKVITRILVLIFQFIIILPLAFIQTDNILVQGLCQILPLGFIVGFLITFVYPKLCHKLGVQLKGDIFFQSDDDFTQQLMENVLE